MEITSIEFKNLDDFLDKISNIDCESVDIVATYEDAKRILKYLSEYNEFYSINLNDEDREFLISTSKEFGIFCEPVKRDGYYVWFGSGVSFILDGCNLDCAKRCESDLVFHVVINDNDDNDEDEGFTISVVDGDTVTTFSYFSSDYQKVKEMAEIASAVLK